MRSRIQGASLCMNSFELFFGLHSDNLSKTLQSRHKLAAEGQKIAEMIIHTLESIRSEENFLLLWLKVTNMANDLDVGDPILPQQRKRPQTFEESTQEEHFPGSVEDFLSAYLF